MNIITDIKNDLLKRREIVVELTLAKTPSFVEMQQQLSEKLKAASEVIAVKSITGGFGNSSFDVEAYVYSSEADKKKFEPKIKIKKDAAGGKK